MFLYRDRVGSDDAIGTINLSVDDISSTGEDATGAGKSSIVFRIWNISYTSFMEKFRLSWLKCSLHVSVSAWIKTVFFIWPDGEVCMN